MLVSRKELLLKSDEVLKTIAASFKALCEVPCRCDTKDLSESDFVLHLPWGGKLEVRGGYVVDAWMFGSHYLECTRPWKL